MRIARYLPTALLGAAALAAVVVPAAAQHVVTDPWGHECRLAWCEPRQDVTDVLGAALNDAGRTAREVADLEAGYRCTKAPRLVDRVIVREQGGHVEAVTFDAAYAAASTGRAFVLAYCDRA